MGCHSLVQGIFPTQGLNPGLLRCSRTLLSEPPGKPTQSHSELNSSLGPGHKPVGRKSSDEKELENNAFHEIFLPSTIYPGRTEDRGVFREDAKGRVQPDESVRSNQEPVVSTRLIQTDVKSEREKQVPCINTYTGNLEKQYR